jgi:dCMP deaminase
MMERPSWDEYFTEITKKVAERSTCDRGHAACVIVKENRILTTGYAGSPKGMPHCDDVGHMLRKQYDNETGEITTHCVRTVHAEQNAITQAAKFGVSLEGSTAYVTMEPCFTCAKMLVQVGVKRVVAFKRYHDDKDTVELFNKSSIPLEVKEDKEEDYANK